MYGFWNQVRDQYSELSLSGATDRLVAIQGLMAAISRYTNRRLASGLWETFLPRAIFWERTPLNSQARRLGLKPTWS